MASAYYTIEEVHDPRYGDKPRLFHCQDYMLPYYTKTTLDAIRDLQVRDNDVFVATFPKSGTTWAQEVIYLIESGVNLESATSEKIDQRFPYLEFFHSSVVSVSNLTSPRFIKTHMPYCFLPAQLREGKAKIIYVARNPKDVTVSYYHFLRGLNKVGYQGNFEDFFEDSIQDKVPYAPWGQHVSDYWRKRDDPNVFFLTYESMHQDLPACIRDLAAFLGKDLSEKQIEAIADHCRFESMKNNPNTNYSWLDEQGMKKETTEFMRKGQVGDWRNHLTSEMSARIDAKYDQWFADTGISLPDTAS